MAARSGADQAAWRAAKAFGVATGGWMQKGFLTEDGPHPDFAARFAAAELPTDSSTARTEQNVRGSDATIWFGETTTAGAQATVGACLISASRACRSTRARCSSRRTSPCGSSKTRSETLNVTGNREDEEAGIGERVEWFLGQVLEQLGHQQRDRSSVWHRRANYSGRGLRVATCFCS